MGSDDPLSPPPGVENVQILEKNQETTGGPVLTLLSRGPRAAARGPKNVIFFYILTF